MKTIKKLLSWIIRRWRFKDGVLSGITLAADTWYHVSIIEKDKGLKKEN